MTQQYGHGFKAVQYIGSKTQKEYKGYIWDGNGDILALPYNVAVDALKHTGVFSEVGAEPLSASFAIAAGTTNIAEVTISVLDADGEVVDAGVAPLDVYLSDDADGNGLTATTASGGIAAKSGEGVDLETVTAAKHLRCLTKNDAGTYVLQITDSAKTGFYVCAIVAGVVYASDQLVTGDYG